MPGFLFVSAMQETLFAFCVWPASGPITDLRAAAHFHLRYHFAAGCLAQR
jgi:hypothetical protein